MKKLVCFFILFSALFTSSTIKNDSYSQYVNKSYIVLNASNNRVMEGKNIHLIRSVASVSKIMSAIVAIESGKLDEIVTITKEDINTYGSSIYLKIGDKISLLDLVYGLMLRSGNDAAKAIARVVGGDIEKFSFLMNEKALEIGMNNSTFTNPSGLDVNERGNLSTSYDLALLMSYALKNEMFLKISGTKEYKSSIGTWANKNKLLRNYDKTIAGKTGFTDKAKRTLVTAARNDETTFVVVTLDCGNDFNFHKFLYEKNFDKYINKLVLNKGENYFDEYIVKCDNDIYLMLEKDRMKEYSLFHYIDEQKDSVYLIDNKEKIKVGDCKIEKVSKKIKVSIFERIRKYFKG